MDASSTTLLATKRRELLSLDSQKKSLESEAEAIVSELTAPLPDGGPPMGIDTPLVDSEGYPRADIDVYRARTLRKRFIEIQNDRKALMGKIERGLVEVTALTKSANDQDDSIEHQLRTAPKPKPKFDPITGQWVVKSWDGSVAGVENGESRRFDDLLARNSAIASDTPNSSADANDTIPTISDSQASPSSTQQPIQILQPFALIDQVFSNSPASSAGIEEGDILLQFGPINDTNHDNFAEIAKLVPQLAGEKKAVEVKVRRRKEMEWGEVWEVVELRLKPRVWEGRGLLGCHISKYDG